MNDRLRIQKQSAQLKEDFPFLAEYLSGWPASTHGTQVLGLAEMKAKELLGGIVNKPLVYAAAPRSEVLGKKGDDVNELHSEKSNNEPGKGSDIQTEQSESVPGRRKVGLGGLNLD